MRILELTNFSSGVCGVFARVKEEAQRLSKKGHEVKIFSSNFIKGSNEIAAEHDNLDKIEIKRFPARKLGGESFMKWDFEKEALLFNPEIIIAHSYRHPHTLKALKIAKKINAKIFLVTHAPFGRERERSFIENLSVTFYDFFIGRRKLKRFDKIIAITRWEMTYLKKLNTCEEKITYIPNGIPEEFFTQKSMKEENKILFLGRIAPIKDIETLIKALPLIEDKKIKLEIVGPAEKDHLSYLESLTNQLNLKNRIIFSPPVFDLIKKIKKIDSAKVFVLPSKSEGMPQSLIEAMARKKIVISSENLGAKELIENEKNGFLFTIGNEKELAAKINLALKTNRKMQEEARKSVEEFSWDKIIKKVENLF